MTNICSSTSQHPSSNESTSDSGGAVMDGFGMLPSFSTENPSRQQADSRCLSDDMCADGMAAQTGIPSSGAAGVPQLRSSMVKKPDTIVQNDVCSTKRKEPVPTSEAPAPNNLQKLGEDVINTDTESIISAAKSDPPEFIPAKKKARVGEGANSNEPAPAGATAVAMSSSSNTGSSSSRNENLTRSTSPDEESVSLARQLLNLDPPRESRGSALLNASARDDLAVAHQLLSLDPPKKEEKKLAARTNEDGLTLDHGERKLAQSKRDDLRLAHQLLSLDPPLIPAKEKPVGPVPHCENSPNGANFASRPSTRIGMPCQTLKSHEVASSKTKAASTVSRPHQQKKQQQPLKSASASKGGIFDDAESDVGSMNPFAWKPQTAKTHAISKGGIFDDADEDESCVPPVYDPLATAPATEPIRPQNSSIKKSQLLLPVTVDSNHCDPSEPIVDTHAVPPVGTDSAFHRQKHPSAPPVGTGRKDAEVAKKSATDPDPKNVEQKKKKKPTKPTKRVLVGRKEKDLATSILMDKDDLVGIISSDHCRFLGKEFWIFTVQQLESVLQSTVVASETNSSSISAELQEPRGSKRSRRTDLLERLSRSKLVRSGKKPDPEAGSAFEKRADDRGEKKEAKKSTRAPTPETNGTDEASHSNRSSEQRVDHRGTGDVTKEMSNGKNSDGETLENAAMDDKAIKAAEAIIESWQKKLDEWKSKGEVERKAPLENKFLLSGPISCLFPKVTQRFFASVPVKSLYDFLCMKKTETGAIIALVAAWRKTCKLADVPPLSLAKHFLGMGLRVETAISSIPPLDETTRKWMGDPIVVLTGAAKEFLIDELKIFSGATFIETRTKDLANQLVEWRTKRGLPPLKGSGKVAMVSSWKANVKEAIDFEEGDGKIIEGVNLQALVEEAEKAPIVKEEKKPQPPIKQPPQQEFTFDPRIPDVDAALHSTQFLKEVLDPQHFAVLQAAGIKTPVELFSAQKKQGSPLALAVSKILPDPSKFELVIFDWCQIVRKKLSGIRRVNSKRKEPPEELAAPKPKKEKCSEPQKEVAPRPNKQELLQKDPFFSLSTVTQTFLGTVGISTAEAFLSSRTTDLSNAFVEWRAKNNMPVLKGQGAIASVSGWKAQMRKVAKERGLEELSQVAPAVPEGSPSRKTKSTEEKSKDTKTKSSAGSDLEKKVGHNSKMEMDSGDTPQKISHPGVLFGKPTRKIVVESTIDPKLRFFFELSLRRKSSGIGLFISFQGAKKFSRTIGGDYSGISQRSVTILDGENGPLSFPLLKDVSKKYRKNKNANSTAGQDVRGFAFSSLEDGCGLLELCKHDVWPLPCQGEMECIFPVIEEFITGADHCKRGRVNESNIAVGKDENGKSQYFLYLNEPSEKGQMLELRFCSPVSSRTKTEAPVRNLRFVIDGEISRMSSESLHFLLERLKKCVCDLDSKLGMSEGVDCADKGASDLHSNPSLFEKVVISKRRAHWLAFRILSRLKNLELKHTSFKVNTVNCSKGSSGGYRDLLWTPQVAAQLKKYASWTQCMVTAVAEEVCEEFETASESHEFVNSANRKRWCSLALELFGEASRRLVRFSTMLEEYSQEELLSEINDLVMNFSRQLKKTSSDNDLEKLVVTFEEDHDGLESASPSFKHAFQTSIAQTYKDALALCNSSGFSIPIPEVQRVLATSATYTTPKAHDAATSQDIPDDALFQTLEHAKNSSAVVNPRWYLKHQVLRVLNSLLSCSAVVLENDASFKEAVMNGIEAALKNSGLTASFGDSRETSLGGTPITYPSEVNSSVSFPNSLPIFLNLVWPALRSSHWRVEAGESPSDVCFLPPGQRSRGQRGDKRTRVLKQDRVRSRIKLAKASTEVGLGFVPKLTKRLFVNAVEMKPLGPRYVREQQVPCVNDALDKFLAKIVAEVPDESSRKRASQVVDYIRQAFDQLFPELLAENSHPKEEEPEGMRPSDFAGCEYLARFIFVLPSILCQGSLSTQIIEDTTIVLQELANFLALNHRELLDKKFHPPKEVYVGEKIVPPLLVSRLANLRCNDDSSESVEISEAIQPEDLPDLTDFVETVMSQVVPCRATQDDVTRKNRKINLGYIGLMCRHCMGGRGEGRYFFTSIESMTTAATVIEKHIQKCPSVPEDIKTKMVESRSRHAEQRRNLAQGAQAAYFLRLWERLRSSKVKDVAASLQVLEMNNRQDAEDEDESTASEFKNHVRLIEYVSKTQPWSERPSVDQALSRYYECLEFGGKVFNTDSMPRRFTSELVLSHMSANQSKLPSNETQSIEPDK